MSNNLTKPTLSDNQQLGPESTQSNGRVPTLGPLITPALTSPTLNNLNNTYYLRDSKIGELESTLEMTNSRTNIPQATNTVSNHPCNSEMLEYTPVAKKPKLSLS